MVGAGAGSMNALHAPGALDPASFGVPVSGALDTPQGSTASLMPAAADSGLNDSDRASLSVALSLLRSARAEAASEDKAVAKQGAWRISVLICYLAGFFDARGLLDGPKGADAGFEALIGSSVKPNINLMLDELENGLAKALVSSDTRSGLSDALHSVEHVMHEFGDTLIIDATIAAVIGAIA